MNETMKHTLELSKSGNTVLLELEQKGRTFQVLKAQVKDRPELSIGFDPASADEVLDETSDARQVFNIAMSVRVQGCTLNMKEMRAADIETLTQALRKVKFRFWNQEEV